MIYYNGVDRGASGIPSMKEKMFRDVGLTCALFCSGIMHDPQCEIPAVLELS